MKCTRCPQTARPGLTLCVACALKRNKESSEFKRKKRQKLKSIVFQCETVLLRFDLANTDQSVVKLGSRGVLLSDAIEKLRRLLG